MARALSCVAALGVAAATAQATSLTWDISTTSGTQAGTGTWGAANMWNDGSANVSWNSDTPDDATFTYSASAYTVTLATSATANNVTFNNISKGITVNNTGGSSLFLSGTMGVVGATGLTISANLTGNGSITIDSGNVNLIGSNNFTGGVTLNSGTLGFNSGGTAVSTATYCPVGTGTLTINGGTVYSNLWGAGQIPISAPIYIGGDFSGISATLGGAMDLGNAIRTINGTGGGASSFSGKVSNGGIIVTGSKGIALNNSANDFALGVTVSAGSVLVITGTSTQVGGLVTQGPIGTGTLTMNGGALNASSNRGIDVSNKIVLNADIGVNTQGGIFRGSVDLAGGVRTITNNQTNGSGTVFSGKISNGGIVIAAGTSTATGGLSLTGTDSDFAGGVTVLGSGVLSISGTSTGTPGAVTAGSLGTGTLTIQNGGTINVANYTKNHNSISVAGDFKTNSNTGGILYGPVDLGASTRTITSTNKDSGLNLNGSIGGTGGLTFSGTGSVTLGGSTSNTYTGLTTMAMTSGTFPNANLTLNKSNSARAIAGDVLLTSGTILMGASSTVNQINPAATMTINGGFYGLYNGSTGKSQVLSKLVYNSGTGSLSFGTATASNLTLGVGAATNNAIAVTTSGTLAGNGTLGILVAGKAGGTIAPGKSGGSLTTGTLSFGNGLNLAAITGGASTIAVNFSLASGTNGVSDKLAITTGVFTGAAGAGGIVINLTDVGLDVKQGTHQTFTLLDWSGSTSVADADLADFTVGTVNFDSLTVSINNVQLGWHNNDSGSKALDVSLDIIAVPEPGSLFLIAMGGIAVLALRKRCRA